VRTHRTVTKLIDYEEFCGLGPGGADAHAEDGLEISARELAQKRERGDDFMLIDVREPQEFEIARIPGSILIPLNSLPERMSELDSSREIVLQCHVGQRSMRALEMLHRSGFRKLKNLRGGIEAWSREVDPSVPRY
jgi:adenylyltransferase/sulfurtransferase